LIEPACCHTGNPNAILNQMPLPAEGLAARLVLGPALRTQPDRRLVALVRDGYETAFDEIVRRYGGPLRRYAAAIVGGRSEDVTQDAFSKALLALRRNGAEIELRPWLFRIVRNTALNELRDSYPSPEALAEEIAGGRGPAEELERREELAELIRRLQSLPEPQRAAIVMRELEGLGHEEIATTLGLSGGAARQAIYRARQALRDGFGMLLPVSLLKTLLSGSAAAPVEVAAGAAGAGGAGVALKAATVTVLVAGALGAGVAIDHGHRHGSLASADAKPVRAGESSRAIADSTQPGPANGTFAHAAQGTNSGNSSGRRDARAPHNLAGQNGDHSGRSESATPPSGPGGGSRSNKDGSGEAGDGDGSPSGKDGGQGSGESVDVSSGSSGSSESGGEGGESDNSGPGDGTPGPTDDDQTVTNESELSNSGPDSGDGGATQQPSTDDLRDPHGASVFSVQETQRKEDR
jgi:RNA polymerase sigma factor (sigma-70 family)